MAEKFTKQELIDRMNFIIENSPRASGETYYSRTNDWQKDDRDRTYFSIDKLRNGIFRKKREYGYLDNRTGEYCPAKYGDLRKNITVSGNSFNASPNAAISRAINGLTEKFGRKAFEIIINQTENKDAIMADMDDLIKTFTEKWTKEDK